MPIQEELTMEAFLGGIDEILQQGFATEEIHGYLQKTLIEPDSLQRYVFFARSVIPVTWSSKMTRLSYWLFAGTSASRRRSMDMKANAAGVGSNKAACYCATTANFPKTRWWCSKSVEPYRGERGSLDGPADIHSVANPLWQWHPLSACTSILTRMINAISMTLTKMKSSVSALRYDSIDGKVIGD